MSEAVRVSDEVYDIAVKKSKEDDISIIEAVDQMALPEVEREPDGQPSKEINRESDNRAVDETDEELIEEIEFRASEAARERAAEIAEERGVPISEVADEVIDKFAGDDDDTDDITPQHD